MIRTVVYSLFILGCLTACKKEVETTVVSSDITQGDTVYDNYVPQYTEPLTAQYDTLITLKGKQYKVMCSAAIDTLKTVSLTAMGRDAKDGKVHKTVYKGYDVNYTISINEVNGGGLFTKTFTKNDFKDIVGGDALYQAYVEAPGFLGYHEGFDAFMFGMSFMIPDSDVGDGCFIMIGRDGRVIDKSHNAFYGGGGVDGRVEVPADNTFVLTPTKILNVNGKKIDLYDENKALVHARMINDHTILVVYDAEEGDTKDNARLIDNYGKVLKTFTYKGYYDLLGYVVPSYVEKTTGTYIMLNDRLDNITVIQAGNPLGIFTIPFKKLRGVKANPGQEITFSIDNEITKYTFAMDTVTKAIRLVKEEN